MGHASEAAGDDASTDQESRFAWHPHYRGKTVAEVAAEIRAALEHDQRAYELALESADERENDTLAAVIDLEKKWGEFDMGWAEADAAALAARIADFEREREQRQELFPYSEYRKRFAAPLTDAGSDRPWWAFWRR